MKKIVYIITLCAAQSVIMAGSGAGWGFAGGILAGGLIASAASQPRTVYVEQPQQRERIVYVDRETGQRLNPEPDDYY